MASVPVNLTPEMIAQRLAIPHKSDEAMQWLTSYFDEPAKPAAVLVPLVYKTGFGKSEWHILYTRRTDSVAEHRGQVAFPGGRADSGDSSVTMTALREAHEEIGLQPEDVRILGKMEILPTISNYTVTPVIGMIPWPYPFRLQTEEVSRVFTIPMDWLARRENYTLNNRRIPDRADAPLLPVITFQAYDGEVLWGISAEITVRFVSRILGS